MSHLLGAGFGLRVGHYADILKSEIHADLAEVVSENFMNRGGRPQAVLEHVRRDMPLILHGVGLSLGSVDPLDERYLRALRDLIAQSDPLYVSDHLCFSSVEGHRAYDLWPLPHTEEAILHLSRRIQQVQNELERPLVIENVSSYVEYKASQMSEAEFLRAVLQESGCLCLLDVNNVYVSAHNHGFSPTEYVDTIPAAQVAYYHLAGHSDYGTHILDDHGSEVPDPVWELYEYALRTVGVRPSIVEWDSNLPTLSELEAQAHRARERLLTAAGQPSAPARGGSLEGFPGEKTRAQVRATTAGAET